MRSTQTKLLSVLFSIGVGASASADDTRDCIQARIDWRILNEEMPVYVTEGGGYRPAWDGDTYKGKRHYIPDKNREALILEA